MSSPISAPSATSLDPVDLLAMASTFTVVERDDDAGIEASITVERRRQRDGSVKWAVYKDGSVLHKAARLWMYDRMNSSRTDGHIAATRWERLEDAMAAAKAEGALMVELGYIGYSQLLMRRQRDHKAKQE